jgi:hypothetical protein
VNDRAYDTDLLDTLSKRVMVGDALWALSYRPRTRSRRNTFGCTLVNIRDYEIAG